ncbi:hypothetical protein ACQEVB_18870 [Pseudonocardia sp. CA-107938]|uniref:hypothetical protein n=1 Tax=Pseudonocardia sp. CA-107938 TaxID=3240021 RepID=UPI003D94C7C8
MHGIEVRRDDGELVGFVAEQDGRWHARTVFGAQLAVTDDERAAESAVRRAGLAALAEPWWLHRDGRWVPVMLVEAAPGRVTLRIGRYPDPTERPLVLTGADAAGLRRRP